MHNFLSLCKSAIGEEHVLLEAVQQAAYLQDWRQRATGKALAVLRPANTEQVAHLVRLCAQFQIPIVPQGGNTGLVLGSIPDQSGNAVVLSLQRLNQIRAIDTANSTMTVDAGCLLAQIQNAADEQNLLFPLSLASEGSCTIGGNLSTNAGGTAVLRYGNMRELCLGLEVVTAQGEIWHGLRGLRKDNTGYDLRDLLIGAEGTLGIITAAVLKLYPKPLSYGTAFIRLNSIQAAVRLLTLAKQHCHTSISGFELINQLSLQLVHQHFPQLQRVFTEASPFYVLLELSSSDTEQATYQQLEQLITNALNAQIIEDAVIANSLAQAKNCWALRESISAAQAKEGKNIKHDISLPISRIADFVTETDLALQQAFPDCRMVTFGHLGDGNLHYNVSPPSDANHDQFLIHQNQINRLVHDKTHQFGGSISAEHGIGTLKKEELLRYKSTVELTMMRNIKRALDPQNIMNPGKII
ncbi:FAD-binding oxidoreductase [Undibacterium danionis]|uniref:FAD-binding oxidoreductase n=1 Tax=Undibacterium danionis TaxID=1812100 RepID=A0ABV6IFW0_9BURK